MTTFGAAMSAQPRAMVVRHTGGRAAVRLLVLTLVWGTVLRNIGGSVGAWTAGSLGAAQTILVGVVIPAWLFVVFPSWLAFRVAAPSGFRRVALAACWMSPLVRLRDLPGIAAFLEIAADRPCPGLAELPADAWIALAAALQADRRRSVAHAGEIADALAHLPAGARFPWLARQHAVEALVVAAVIRRDWAAAARYGRIGQGRLIAFLLLLARATRGERVPARALWLRWLLAPMRGATLPLVRALARRSRIAAEPAAPAASVHVRHVGLLAAAARNEEIQTDDVLSLAAAWQPAIDDGARAALHARALELGVRDGAARAEAVRAEILDELAMLLARAGGGVPATLAQPLAETLARRTREQQLARVKAALEALDADRVGPSLAPLAAWGRWLALRAAWERAEQIAGRAVLTTLWRTAMRDRLWSYCCALSHVHGPRAAWASHAMFDWLADRAEYVGDLVAVLANRENARLALAMLR